MRPTPKKPIHWYLSDETTCDTGQDALGAWWSITRVPPYGQPDAPRVVRLHGPYDSDDAAEAEGFLAALWHVRATVAECGHRVTVREQWLYVRLIYGSIAGAAAAAALSESPPFCRRCVKHLEDVQ